MFESGYPPPRINKQTIGSFGSALVLAGTIFLGLALTQLRSDPSPDKPEGELWGTTIAPPDDVPPDLPDPPEKEEEEEKPELEEKVPPLTLDQLEATMNPVPSDCFGLEGWNDGLGATPDSIGEMKTYLINELDQNPRRLFAVRPVYPIKLKRNGVEGSTSVIIIVDEEGNVIEARVQGATHREFARAAIDAVLQWKFEPGMRNNKPVRVERIQPFTFNMADQ